MSTTQSKRIGLVAHDNKKADLVEWARFNRGLLAEHELWATGTTGLVLEADLGLPVSKLNSGPLGGDQQLGAMIAQGDIDLLIFFWDPLEPMPHDPDVKALLRIAVVWNIPVASNRASADLMISSPLMGTAYTCSCPTTMPTAPGSSATTNSPTCSHAPDPLSSSRLAQAASR